MAGTGNRHGRYQCKVLLVAFEAMSIGGHDAARPLVAEEVITDTAVAEKMPRDGEILAAAAQQEICAFLNTLYS